VDELADVTITAGDEEWLADFTRRLVADGLAACGNIIPRVRSIYSWEGNVEDDNEALVILHTRRSLVPQIIERTKKEHADDVPQVIALAVSEANPAYRDWLLGTTRHAAEMQGRRSITPE
jgi:periplasmic divalent cation tolerance protein